MNSEQNNNFNGVLNNGMPNNMNGVSNNGMSNNMNGVPNNGMPNNINGVPNNGMSNNMNGVPNNGMPNSISGIPNNGMSNNINAVPNNGMSNNMNGVSNNGMPNNMSSVPNNGMSNNMNGVSNNGMPNNLNGVPNNGMPNNLNNVPNNGMINNNYQSGTPISNKSKNNTILIVVIALLVLIILVFIGFFVGNKLFNNDKKIDKGSVTTNEDNVTPVNNDNKKTDNENTDNTIAYNGINYIIPNGYTASLDDDELMFESDTKVYSISLIGESMDAAINEFITAFNIQPKDVVIDNISFKVFDLENEGMHFISYLLPTSKENLIVGGCAMNSSFVYDETILNDVLVSLGLSSQKTQFDSISSFKADSSNSNLDINRIKNFIK